MSGCYQFGPFLLEPARRRLIRGGELVTITAKAFDVLVLLVEARDRIVSRDELFDRLWTDTVVEDNNLSQQIHRLRRLLGSDAGPSPIATVPGQGFQFIATVRDAPSMADTEAVSPAPTAESRRAPVWPTALDPLLGRDEDVEHVLSLLRAFPLVTLTGPGGVGKTRLAIEAGHRFRDEVSDGAYWIDLTQASRPDDLVPLVARALGLADTGKRSLLARIRDWLSERDSLIVIDNFEHVLDAASVLLAMRPPDSNITFLITSRALLRIRGEHEYDVRPLRWTAAARDEQDNDRGWSPAVRLFLDRCASHAGPAALDSFDVADVRTLCARLDGLPLAIELAAARARYVSLTALLHRDRLVAFLPAARRDVPERQHTLQRTLRWSYELLGAVEQRALRSLAVFTGGFTVEAASQVLVGAGVVAEEGAAIDAVAALRSNSLVAVANTESSAVRLRLLETVREFSLDLLDAGEASAVRSAHAQWAIEVAEREAPHLRTAADREAMVRLLTEHANLVSALRWMADADDPRGLIRLVNATVWFWHTANLFVEGTAWTARALARLERGSDVGAEQQRQLLVGDALFAYHVGDFDRGLQLVDRVLAVASKDFSAGLACTLQAAMLAYAGDLHAATAVGRDAQAAADRLGDPWLRGFSALVVGIAASLAGDHQRAYAAIASAPHGLGFLDLLIDVNRNLQALLVGRIDEAAQGFAARLGQRYGAYLPIRQLTGGIEGLAYVASRRGNHGNAALLLGAADRWRRETSPLHPVWFGEHDRTVATVRVALGPRFDACWAEGASLTLEEALSLAASVARGEPSEPSAHRG